MDMLQQSLKTRLPFVHVTTHDLVHIREVLSHIAGEEVKPVEVTPDGVTNWPQGNVFYTNCDTPTSKLYLQCKNAGKCLVFVNSKTSALHFSGGVMFPPKDLMQSYLLSMVEDEKLAESLMPAYGGLTLKDMYEVTRLTLNRAGKLSAREINQTRQGYITKLRGITQIDTAYSYYQSPHQLQGWMDENLPFFTKPVSAALTPRGLLFDGPPGTGKTMGAKHLAQTLGVPLYHLDIGGMKGKYVGDSEGNLHAALAQVDQVEPCVVLFDEVEKIFCEQSDSGVTSSLLSTLLWWLQEHKTKVFTVMTTNNVKKIPPELYREGRIDATMMFNGLESFGDAVVFAQEVFAAMATEIWPEIDVAPDMGALKGILQALFAEGKAVPQVKVTKEVHSLVKKMLMEAA